MNPRYSRQIILPEVGEKGQQAIKNARVLIVGMGGLGCPAAQYLAASGVGHLGLIDSDLVEESNLSRQILYTQKDIGGPKVEIAATALRSINPSMEIICFYESLNSKNVNQILEKFEIIIDCTDNFETKFLLNDTSLQLRKTLITASATGFEGNLLIVKNGGPCLRCLYPNALTASVGNCNLEGVLGAFVGIVGSWQAAEALKIILSFSDQNEGLGKVLFFDFINSRVRSVSLEKNPACLCHQNFNVMESNFNIRMDQLDSLKDYIFVDVRSEEDRENSQAPIDSINIPHLEIISGEIPLEFWLKDKNYVLFCNKGQRSATAKNYLRKNGLENIYCLERI
jgi:sulfur-carrier protein adenylyltransferase/sulfurtransferase